MHCCRILLANEISCHKYGKRQAEILFNDTVTVKLFCSLMYKKNADICQILIQQLIPSCFAGSRSDSATETGQHNITELAKNI